MRAGTTGEDRKDLKDEEMRSGVWTGVVPAYLTLGKPVEAPSNLRREIPGYLEEWVVEENRKGERYACDAAK